MEFNNTVHITELKLYLLNLGGIYEYFTFASSCVDLHMADKKLGFT